MTTLEREIERVASRALRESHLSGGAPLGIFDGLEAFVAAINFTEPLIVGILAVHVIFLITAVLTRKRSNVQIGLLVVACTIASHTYGESRCIIAPISLSLTFARLWAVLGCVRSIVCAVDLVCERVWQSPLEVAGCHAELLRPLRRVRVCAHQLSDDPHELWNPHLCSGEVRHDTT